MGVERYGSKTDVVVKLVLVFFIALLSFSIGTFVGKKFSDNQHKLAQLEPTEHETVSDNGGEGHEGANREVASVDQEGHEAKTNEALSDDDIAKLAEEFVSEDEEGGAAEHKDAHGEAQASAHGETHGEATAHAPAKTAEHGEASAHSDRKVANTPSHEDPHANAEAEKSHGEKKAAAKSIPSSLPATIGSAAIGKFTVQVASYAEETEAQKRAADLKAQGFSAFYVSAAIKGKTWYRVSVGLFATQKEAAAYKEDLVTRAKVTSAIIQKISDLQ